MKKRYDIEVLESEDRYLHAGMNSQVVKQILDEQRRYLCDANMNIKYLVETKKKYDKIIDLIAKLIRELKLENNSIVLSIILRKLILDGYFSENNKFDAISKGSFYDVAPFYGMDIVIGSGCCRHLASFNRDIFKNLGIFNQVFNCYYSDEGETLKQVFSMCSNHAANLIKYNDILYGYNCFENYLFRTVDGFTMMEITNYDKLNRDVYKLFYKPSATVMTSDISYKEAIDLINIFSENSKNKMIDYEDYLRLNKEAKVIFNSNFDMFQDLKSGVSEHAKKLSRYLMYEHGEMIDDLHG